MSYESNKKIQIPRFFKPWNISYQSLLTALAIYTLYESTSATTAYTFSGECLNTLFARKFLGEKGVNPESGEADPKKALFCTKVQHRRSDDVCMVHVTP